MIGLAPALFLGGSLHASQTASFAWNPVTTTQVSGYAFYVGPSNGVYTSRFDVGTNTEINISGLQEGQTNFFAVTSYNSARMESAASPSISYIVPGLVRFAPPSTPGAAGTISFPVAAGHSYQLQASTNLVSWTNLWQPSGWSSNVWVSYQDTQTKLYSKRFYRLIMN